jgi:hypothetical protein
MSLGVLHKNLFSGGDFFGRYESHITKAGHWRERRPCEGLNYDTQGVISQAPCLMRSVIVDRLEHRH